MRVHAVVHTAVLALWEVRSGRPFPTHEQWRALKIPKGMIMPWYQGFHIAMIVHSRVSPEQWDVPDAFFKEHLSEIHLSDLELGSIRKMMAHPIRQAEITQLTQQALTPEQRASARLN
jgi:hypothetical protein